MAVWQCGVLWTLSEGVAWGLSLDPPVSSENFLRTLHELCRCNRVPAFGLRWDANTGAPLIASEQISPHEWADLHFDCDSHKLQTDDLLSFSLRRRAWTLVRFRAEDLIREWPRADEAALGEEQAARYWTVRERAFERRTRRLSTFNRRERCLRRNGRWISIRELSDWLAHEAGAAGINSDIEASTYLEFWQASRNREFDRGGKTRVLLLNPAVTRARLDPEGEERALDVHGWASFVQQFLAYCWVEIEPARQWLRGWLPRDLYETWDAAHAAGAPPHSDQGGLAASSAPKSTSTQTKRRLDSRGGRPPKWDWEGCAIALIAYANTPDGLPESQAAIERLMATYFNDRYGYEPSESLIREHAAKIIAELCRGRKSPP